MSIMRAEEVMSKQRAILLPQFHKFVRKIQDDILEHVKSKNPLRHKRFDLIDTFEKVSIMNDTFDNHQLLAYVLEELEGLGYSCRLRPTGIDDYGHATALELIVSWGPALDRFLP